MFWGLLLTVSYSYGLGHPWLPRRRDKTLAAGAAAAGDEGPWIGKYLVGVVKAIRLDRVYTASELCGRVNTRGLGE